MRHVMMKGADSDGPYRYALWRRWGYMVNGSVLWVMLNPSTADADVDDPTIRRCVSFSQSWGYAAMAVVNLFAWRATDHRELRSAVDPIGPRNDDAIRGEVDKADLVVAAWGANGGYRNRDCQVLTMLGLSPMCLGRTKDGSPRHPLYMPGRQRLKPLREVKP